MNVNINGYDVHFEKTQTGEFEEMLPLGGKRMIVVDVYKATAEINGKHVEHDVIYNHDKFFDSEFRRSKILKLRFLETI